MAIRPVHEEIGERGYAVIFDFDDIAEIKVLESGDIDGSFEIWVPSTSLSDTNERTSSHTPREVPGCHTRIDLWEDGSIATDISEEIRSIATAEKRTRWADSTRVGIHITVIWSQTRIRSESPRSEVPIRSVILTPKERLRCHDTISPRHNRRHSFWWYLPSHKWDTFKTGSYPDSTGNRRSNIESEKIRCSFVTEVSSCPKLATLSREIEWREWPNGWNTVGT
ncbi:MAG: hypothetical protein ACD_78C00459G0001, partial [uncultured bacterium (gcode 4)]